LFKPPAENQVHSGSLKHYWGANKSLPVSEQFMFNHQPTSK